MLSSTEARTLPAQTLDFTYVLKYPESPDFLPAEADHVNDCVFFNDQVSIDAEITEMMREVSNIQQHMRPIILEVYGRFLVESSDIEEREYADPYQEIEANLIHRNYISQKDIEVCLTDDILKHESHTNFSAIEALHQSLQRRYAVA